MAVGFSMGFPVDRLVVVAVEAAGEAVAAVQVRSGDDAAGYVTGSLEFLGQGGRIRGQRVAVIENPVRKLQAAG